MEYVRLGGTGLKVSQICLGCMSFGSAQKWMLSEEDSQPIIKDALDGGINFFDTANIYSRGQSEEILGRTLKSFGVSRHQSVIATKVCGAMGDGPNDQGLGRTHILQSVDDSLRRLGTDYIDLLQIHRFDEETPIEETLQALSDVVRAGKVRFIGASSMATWKFAKMNYTADLMGLPRFVSMQNNYSLIHREEEREMNPFCLDQGIGLIPWGPLGGGVLTGSRRTGTVRSAIYAADRFRRAEDEAVVDVLAEVAEARGVNPAQVAIAWLLSKPAVTAPIVGVTKREQLQDPLKAVGMALTQDEIDRLEGVYVTQPMLPVGNLRRQPVRA